MNVGNLVKAHEEGLARDRAQGMQRRLVSLTRRIVCLCGSTKFKQAFLDANLAQSLKGHIVLSVSAYMHADSVPMNAAQLAIVHDLHFAKIDLADEILVLNVGGYIGEQTAKEINYAFRQNKAIEFLEPMAHAQLRAKLQTWGM